MKKTILLLFFSFFIVSSFLISSPSYAITKLTTNFNTTYDTSLATQNYMEVNIPIGRNFQINWTNTYEGIEPSKSTLYQKVIGSNCYLFVDSELTFPEKSLRYKDELLSSLILTKISLSNNTNLKGSIDFGLKFNPILDNQKLWFFIMNNFSSISLITLAFYYSSILDRINVETYEISGGMLFLLNHYVYGNSVFISIDYDCSLNKQYITILNENLSVYGGNVLTYELSQNWYSSLKVNNTILQFSTSAVYVCDVSLLGISHSFENGFIKYNSFNLTYINRIGYYSTVVKNILLKGIAFDFANPTIIKGNITIIVILNTKQYMWVKITPNNRFFIMLESVFFNILSLGLDNYSSYNLEFFSFDPIDYKTSEIRIVVRITISYDYLIPNFLDLYLNGGLYLILLVAIPVLIFQIGKRKSIMFWLGLFFTDVLIMIWQNLFNMGGILSLASVLVILLLKMGKDE